MDRVVVGAPGPSGAVGFPGTGWVPTAAAAPSLHEHRIEGLAYTDPHTMRSASGLDGQGMSVAGYSSLSY